MHILFNYGAAARESQINQGISTNSNHHMNSEIFRLQMHHSSQKKDNLNNASQTSEYNNQRNNDQQKIDSVIVLGWSIQDWE